MTDPENVGGGSQRLTRLFEVLIAELKNLSASYAPAVGDAAASAKDSATAAKTAAESATASAKTARWVQIGFGAVIILLTAVNAIMTIYDGHQQVSLQTSQSDLMTTQTEFIRTQTVTQSYMLTPNMRQSIEQLSGFSKDLNIVSTTLERFRQSVWDFTPIKQAIATVDFLPDFCAGLNQSRSCGQLNVLDDSLKFKFDGTNNYDNSDSGRVQFAVTVNYLVKLHDDIAVRASDGSPIATAKSMEGILSNALKVCEESTETASRGPGNAGGIDSDRTPAPLTKSQSALQAAQLIERLTTMFRPVDEGFGTERKQMGWNSPQQPAGGALAGFTPNLFVNDLATTLKSYLYPERLQMAVDLDLPQDISDRLYIKQLDQIISKSLLTIYNFVPSIEKTCRERASIMSSQYQKIKQEWDRFYADVRKE